MEKLAFFFNEEIKKIVYSFAYCFKVNVTIFSPTMEVLFWGLENKVSDYCQLVQQKLNLKYKCIQQDRMMCTQCEKTSQPLIYQCYAGLMEAVIPLKLNNRLVGYAMIGQFRNREDIPQEILNLWLEKFKDSTALQKAFDKQPYYEKQAIDNMINLFEMLCSYIVSREYIKVRQVTVIDNVIDYIKENISVSISLDEVAKKIGYSRSCISHTIKRELHISFKQLCIQKKIERFESLIQANPKMYIQEAAFSVGYDDPLYFSRIYKKVRFVNPSTFIKSVRNQ